MRRLFLHFYLFMLLILLALGWSVERIWQQQQTDEVPAWVQLLGQSLAYQLTYPDQDPRQIAGQLNIPLQQLQLASIPWSAAELAALERGQLVPLFSEDNVYFYQQTADALLQFGPVRIAAPSDYSYGYTLLFFILLGVAIALWLWPLARDIQQLQGYLFDFGKGKAIPSQLLPAHSLLEPIATSVGAMSEQIQRLVALQREMTHAVSHELRTPLARLKFALELQAIPEQDKHAMLEDVRELDQLVDEMLDYARLESDSIRLNLEDVNVCELLYNLVEKLQGLPGPNIDCQLPSHFWAQVDAHYLERAVQNLLVNAKRHARHHVRLQLLSQGHQWLIQVEDDGPGIPETQREAIFQPFVRLDPSRSKGRGGFGLGLAIVQRIVNWHHGRIDIRDSELGGANFSVWLPVLQ